MKLFNEPVLSEESLCPYIKNNKWRCMYFFATDVSGEELDIILSRGWRKFGMYYFRPACMDCNECIPIRIRAHELTPTKSQKRAIKTCMDVQVQFRELEFRDEIYEIYQDHSTTRFSKDSNIEDFYNSFYTKSCPAMQSEYYINNTLVAVGFLDVSSNALSSIYFIYRNEFSSYRLGTFSVIRETEQAISMGLDYYYLGYFIKSNRSMAYKNSFHINEKMDWETGLWLHEKDFYCPENPETTSP
jgi:arginine-tRNA-protein transferase